ncbi:bifunctional cytochrome P450/NADPH--P450 reductase [Lichenicola sp.]|uniref:bifunctional cytochrome P450/NADPH--P450 reductase n=1 Tax=Lichenicola sp. TaxID=2804529 RepID=UPI003B00CEF6
MTVEIPQPRTVPFLGNLTSIDSHAPVQSLMRLAREQGPIYRLSLAGSDLTIVSSHALVNELCDEARFVKAVHASLQQFRPITGDGLFTAYNDEPNWAKAHALLMPAFGPIGIRGMFPKMLDIAEQMLLRWERFGDATIDVADNMTRLTLDTIALCAFDYRFNSFYQNEMHPFVSAMVGALDEAGARARRPSVASRIMLPNRLHFDADVRFMHSLADTLVTERRAARKFGQAGADGSDAGPQDLLDIMLTGRDPATGEGLDDENIRNQMVTFLIAGHETTSGLLSFALYFLLANPGVLEKARAQIDEVLGATTPQVEELHKLHVVEQILMETLRLWPTAPAFAVQPREPTVIGGRYAVTPDDALLVLIPTLHRDRSVWGDDVEQFRPERFEPERAKHLPPNAWKPFGNGHRSCIGRVFAFQEAQLALAMILQRFDIELADPDYRLMIAETLTIKPHGLTIHARRRDDNPSRVRSAMPSAPQRKLTPAAGPARPLPEPIGRLLVLYGSNTGSCEAFARRIAGDAAGRGYAAVVATMDDYVERLPAEGAVVIVTASYEGQPPDNARHFVEWLEGVPEGSLAGVSFAVFGCGNRQWARTYQATPKRVDAAMQAAGAERIRPRGETDASGDFFGAFDDWYRTLWSELGRAFGRAVADEAAFAAPAVEVEILRSGREAVLRVGQMEQATVLVNRELAQGRDGPGGSKRHLELALPQGMTYRCGDYIAVLPRNDDDRVGRVLRRFGFAAETAVVLRGGAGGSTTLPLGIPISVGEILSNFVELEVPASRDQIGLLVEATRCPPDKAALSALADPETYRREILDKRVSVLALLERFPACELSFAAFLSTMPGLRVRQYSISSSPLHDPGRCSITLAVLDAPALSGQGRHHGIASSYLARLPVGARLSVAVRQSQAAFHPPADPATPLIMVCAGSGIAPFRGFLQERAIRKAAGGTVGPALLFFGITDPDVDYLYRDELAAWEAQGLVSVRMAFSRRPEGEVRYVQHRVWQDRADLADLFRQNGTMFVCGDGQRMAPAVRETVIRIYQEARAVSAEEAEQWADRIEHETARYVADVFS